ncbi:MAG: IS66 family insertion sequence element accessory protein TnpB, partial [Verrucomicrobiae bacterium]|nr:IS66 family insertion sequence element accessory protein TnpB [Verrucomicrobiae bacterium]
MYASVVTRLGGIRDLSYALEMEVSKSDRCFVYGGVVDLRKGAPGLSALVGNPQEDTLYLFSNRQRNLLKFLSVDKFGTWVGTRRLFHSRFCWPEDPRGRQKLTAKELACLLIGGD